MAAKKAARKKPGSKSAYVALSLNKPTGEIASILNWIRVWFRPPDYHVITIQNDTVSAADWKTHASRGFLKFSADWVCWVNKDSKAHTVKFIGGKWPFVGNPALKQVPVPAAGPSQWYRIDHMSGSVGQSVPFEYFVDVAPGPDGPSVISED